MKKFLAAAALVAMGATVKAQIAEPEIDTVVQVPGKNIHVIKRDDFYSAEYVEYNGQDSVVFRYVSDTQGNAFSVKSDVSATKDKSKFANNNIQLELAQVVSRFKELYPSEIDWETRKQYAGDVRDIKAFSKDIARNGIRR